MSRKGGRPEMGYNKMTPRSNRIDGRVGGKAEDLAARGRIFFCNHCKTDDGEVGLVQLSPREVVGGNIEGLFHKGFLGHKVRTELTKVCQLPACGCTGEAHG